MGELTLREYRMALENILAGLKKANHNPNDSVLLKLATHVLCVQGEWLLDICQSTAVRIETNVDALSTSIARAARKMLAEKGVELDEARVLLLLPSENFLHCSLQLKGVAAPAVRAALRLQAQTLLPANDEPLAFAVNEQRPDMAWWIKTRILDDLFAAMADQGLFLLAAAPRAAALLTRVGHDHSEQWFVDRDSTQITALHATTNGITDWFQTNIADLQQADFAAEWQQLLDAAGCCNPLQLENYSDWLIHESLDVSQVSQVLAPYVVFPAAALAARFSLSRRRQKKILMAATVLIVAIAGLPFVVQTIQSAILENSWATIKEQAAPARENQSFVREFEAQWGALTEFPRQDLINVLIALQTDIAPGVLTALDVKAGYINIEGESPDPENLLEQLEKNPMFTEVDYARATNNNRYSIDLRLTTVNFPAYLEWYFPEPR